MGNFFEDLVHSVLESTLTEDEQTALKVCYVGMHEHALVYYSSGHGNVGQVPQTQTRSDRGCPQRLSSRTDIGERAGPEKHDSER